MNTNVIVLSDGETWEKLGPQISVRRYDEWGMGELSLGMKPRDVKAKKIWRAIIPLDVDLEMLRIQKAFLYDVGLKLRPKGSDGDALEGLLNLLDHIEDELDPPEKTDGR